MISFNNYERIIILENNSVKQIIISDKSSEKIILPAQAPGEDVFMYLEHHVLTDQNLVRDLIIAVFKSPIDGDLILLGKIINKMKDSGDRTEFIVMAEILEAAKYAYLKEMGIENIVVGKENVEYILGSLKFENQ